MTPSHHLAEFYDHNDLNRYLAVLPTALACDIILWTYNSEEEPTKDFYFSVDLDLGTFCNDGGSNHTNLVWEPNQYVDVYTAFAARDCQNTLLHPQSMLGMMRPCQLVIFMVITLLLNTDYGLI